MAKCKHVYEDGRTCQANAQVLGDSAGWCPRHDPTISDEIKREWAIKGGRASRRVQPMALDDLPDDIKDAADLKSYYLSIIKALVTGAITPTQSRALVGAGAALRDTLELELYESLARRVGQLEGEEAWQLVEPGSNTLPDGSDN